MTRPPGPRPGPAGIWFFDLRRDPIGQLRRAVATYGNVVYLPVTGQPMYVVNEPELIHEVLVAHPRKFAKSRGLERLKMLLGEGLLTSEGDFHLRQRRLMQPAFHRARVAGYGSVMVDFAARAVEGWRDGQEMDVAREMNALTLAIAAHTLLGAGVDERDITEIRAALEASMQSFAIAMLPFMEFIERIPILPHIRRFQSARARLDAIVYRFIENRRRDGAHGGDLLSMLLNARDEDGDARMTDQQVRDEALTILLAGHETTANALTWTWYLLSQNPDAEAAMHREIDAVLGGRRPTVEDLPRLAYTRRVFAESMRLYPPAWLIGRRALEEYRLGRWTLPRRAIVLMCQGVTHRDPRFFADPDRFDPDRFLPENEAKRPKFAYYPFGGGNRVCIGEPFAWMEGVLLLATLGGRWRFRLVPGHVVEPQALVTLRPRHGMRMTAQERVPARCKSGDTHQVPHESPGNGH